MTKTRRAAAVGLLALIFLTARTNAWAEPFVVAIYDDLGGGIFQYNLFVHNVGGTEAIAGLLVIHGFDVFGPMVPATIDAPQDWDFIAPGAEGDPLNYFSTDSDRDVPIGASLGGFSFQSTTSPDMLHLGDFAIEGIGAISDGEIYLGDAQLVPEPSSLWLLGGGLLGLAACIRRTRSFPPATSPANSLWRS